MAWHDHSVCILSPMISAYHIPLYTDAVQVIQYTSPIIVRRHLARSVGREELLPLGEHGGFSLVEVLNWGFAGIVMFYNLGSITAKAVKMRG